MIFLKAYFDNRIVVDRERRIDRDRLVNRYASQIQIQDLLRLPMKTLVVRRLITFAERQLRSSPHGSHIPSRPRH